MDLEWNQSPEGKAGSVENLPFEIIEIGAVKLNSDFKEISRFSKLINPVVYKGIHHRTREVINISMEELRRSGRPFLEVIENFFAWCFKNNEEPVFCTWGNMDLTELQRNMDYYRFEYTLPYPLMYYNVQKLYSRLYLENKKDRLPLEKAICEQGIEPDYDKLHSASYDAHYTAKLLSKMDFSKVSAYKSIDYYIKPRCRDEEIYMVFPDYSKYVSREFDSREEALADKTVRDVLCYKCRRMLKRKVDWFLSGQKNYYCVAICPEHGFVKGKIHCSNSSDDKVYIIKTIKISGKNLLEDMKHRKEEFTKKRNLKNRLRKMSRRLPKD